MREVRLFLAQILEHSAYSTIPKIIDIYQRIFDKLSFEKEIEFSIQRIYKLHFFRDPGQMDRTNSTYHIKLKLLSDTLIDLDQLYEGKLSGLLQVFKHLFTKLDNLYSEQNPTKAEKYLAISLEVDSELTRFLEASEKRAILDKRQKLQEVHLSKLPYGGLFYIAPISNLQGIFEKGILSHNKAHGDGAVLSDISNLQVNERRKRPIDLTGRSIHDYAPLYINPKNPMLYTLCINGKKDDLVLLNVLPQLLVAETVLFSDGNAASQSTKFYKDIEEFNRLPWDCINDEVWSRHADGKRFRCAEVLVPDRIPPPYILEVLCPNERVLEKVVKLFPNHFGIRTKIEPTMFF
jgi:hypothetical protein